MKSSINSSTVSATTNAFSNKLHTGHQKIVPSGYSLNRFPLGNLSSTDIVRKDKQGSNFSSYFTSGSANFWDSTVPKKMTTSYGNIDLKQRPRDVVLSTRNPVFYNMRSTCSSDSDGCYENVIASKSDSVSSNNYTDHNNTAATAFVSPITNGNNISNVGRSADIDCSLAVLNANKLLLSSMNGCTKMEYRPITQTVPIKMQSVNGEHTKY
ncbi:unnamed protein product [Enterobius vermicularis]|uniref:Nucleoporin NUP53 n=1 Tax=Enterobius vermicularis TaxID=51028 RepID=A0A0N4VC33_ENTVE|nr:unnamed protein product [Enterobius vermicularis]